MLVKQRDNEIGILLNYLNKQKEAGGGDASIPVDSFQAPGNATHNGAMMMGNMSTTTNSTAAAASMEEETKQPTLF